MRSICTVCCVSVRVYLCFKWMATMVTIEWPLLHLIYLFFNIHKTHICMYAFGASTTCSHSFFLFLFYHSIYFACTMACTTDKRQNALYVHEIVPSNFVFLSSLCLSYLQYKLMHMCTISLCMLHSDMNGPLSLLLCYVFIFDKTVSKTSFQFMIHARETFPLKISLRSFNLTNN